ncbi:hypothetical protein NQT74_18370 [Alteromonas stellipolaris]|uniref:hypothetical protein n=1 Tax=Alteromonas stellipolaris TaxID=233316 RepID=UPI002117B818|nr:hypothetical protein [Alteromonas stellipolaris]MCQ8850551.1 hypothetical protein [Alteromonas stellipolaris]
MKLSLVSFVTATLIILYGCGSTPDTVQPDKIGITAPPAIPQSYQTMVDFGIINASDANEVVNGQRTALSNNLGKFRESALGQLTDGGDMFLGFAIAQLFGGGVSLTDFFNPLSMFRGNQYENHLKKTFFWVEVDENCDRECAFKKIKKIVASAATAHTENLIKISEKGDSQFNWKRNYDAKTAVREIDVFGTKKTFFGKKLSKSYANNLVIMPEDYDSYKREKAFFTIWDAEFKTVNGKRYFGSKITTRESFTASLHRMGNYFRWEYDNSQTLGFAKASETYPDFILIETQNCISQFPFRSRDKVIRTCQGDLLINGGKVTYMHLFPDSNTVRLQDSNLINAKIHDARSEIFTEQEWQTLLNIKSGETTVSNQL